MVLESILLSKKDNSKREEVKAVGLFVKTGDPLLDCKQATSDTENDFDPDLKKKLKSIEQPRSFDEMKSFADDVSFKTLL